MQTVQTNPQMMHLIAEIMTFYLFFFVIILVAIIIPTWFICKKAGFSPWLSFIVIIPFGGLVPSLRGVEGDSGAAGAVSSAAVSAHADATAAGLKSSKFADRGWR
jgi:uncharacterized membrane protein YhaH (DUF805 family)